MAADSTECAARVRLPQPSNHPRMRLIVHTETMQEGLNTRIGFGTITFPVIAVWLAMTAALLRGHVADYRFAQNRLGAVTPGLIYESAQSGPDQVEATELARLADGLVGIRYLALLDVREQRLGHWSAADPEPIPGLVGGLLRVMGATQAGGSVRRVVAPEASAGEAFLLEIGLAAPIADPQFVQRFRQLLGLSTGIGLLALAVLILVRVRLSRPAHELELALRRLVRGEDAHQITRLPAPYADAAGSIRLLSERLRYSRDHLRTHVLQATDKLHADLNRLRRRVREVETERDSAVTLADSRRELLSGLSHELRTPLIAILGQTDLVLRQQPDAATTESLLQVKRSVQSLLTLINDWLEWGRIEAGKLTLNEVAFNLLDTVEDTINLLAPLAYEKDLELVHIIYHDVPRRLRGDAARVQQVLTNLLSNAIKFTQRGEVVLRVMSREDHNDDVVLGFQVSDTGIGIPQAQQQRLFHAFNRADHGDTAVQPGTGLGLSISRQIVRMMDGHIEFDSTEGEGSRFEAVMRIGKQSRRPDQPLAWTGLKNRHVWLLDGHATARLALRHCLEYWSTELTEFEDAALATAQLRSTQQPPDLMLIGVTAAQVADGWLHALLQDGHRSHVPMVVLVTSIDHQILARLRDLGANAALPKTVDRESLYRELIGALEYSAQPRRRPLEGVTCLVVENNITNRRLLVRSLQDNGAQVLEAADGDTGLELAQEHAPSVILLDHRMPGRDGVETATALRALDGGSGFLIIGLSASVTPELRERWLQAGADSVLEKSAEDRVLIRHMLRLTEQAPAAELELTADPELRDMLVDELPLQVDAILQSWQRRDTRAVYDAVHQLHGTAAFYKLHALREVSRRLESRLTALSDTEALDELAPLRSTLCSQVDAYLDKLGRQTPTRD